MRFLANENFPLPSITFLRHAGYNISSVSEQYPGISDYKVIGKAKVDNLIILTFDKDYGEIIFKHGQENPPAVIFFRFKGENPEMAGQLLIDLIENKNLKVENKFKGISKNLAFYGLNPSPFSGREGYKEFLETPLIEKESIRQRTY